MPKFNRQSAFTLIEVLVAMAIMALIGVGALKVLNTSTELNQRIEKDGNRLNQIERAFLMISDDMQQLTVRRVRDEYGDRLPAMKSDIQAPNPYLRLTRLGRRNPAQLPRSNLEHLIYSVEDKTLYRIGYSYVDGMVADQGNKRALLEKVEGMKMTFYDGEEWHDYWPLSNDPQDAAANQLPVAVKLELELTDYGKIERLYALSDKLGKQEAQR